MERVGIIEITPEFIADVVKLPEGHKIKNCFVDPFVSRYTGNICLVVEGPQMPEHQEGSLIQRVRLVMKKAAGQLVSEFVNE